jgi:hypothetical protein
LIVVVECKVGTNVSAADRRQVEEYALDLRDFHAQSYQRKIVPVLWSTNAESSMALHIRRYRRPTGQYTPL